MPSFNFTQNLTANVPFNPLLGWQYEYVPFPARVSLLVNAAMTTITDVVNLVVTSGSETIQESSPIQNVAAASQGQIPSPLNVPVVSWLSPAGDRLKLNFLTASAGAVKQVSGVITLSPLR
jgi:hypothetical protein